MKFEETPETISVDDVVILGTRDNYLPSSQRSDRNAYFNQKIEEDCFEHAEATYRRLEDIHCSSVFRINMFFDTWVDTRGVQSSGRRYF